MKLTKKQTEELGGTYLTRAQRQQMKRQRAADAQARGEKPASRGRPTPTRSKQRSARKPVAPEKSQAGNG